MNSTKEQVKRRRKTWTLRVYSWVDGIRWLSLLPLSMNAGSLEMLTQEADVMGVGILGDVEKTMVGTGDNSGSSISSALSSGRLTWELSLIHI